MPEAAFRRFAARLGAGPAPRFPSHGLHQMGCIHAQKQLPYDGASCGKQRDPPSAGKRLGSGMWVRRAHQPMQMGVVQAECRSTLDMRTYAHSLSAW